jgi:hypothetical protein
VLTWFAYDRTNTSKTLPDEAEMKNEEMDQFPEFRPRQLGCGNQVALG